VSSKLRELRPAERRLLAFSLLALPLVAASVRLVGLRRTRNGLFRACAVGVPRSFGVSRPDTVARLVRVAARRGLVRVSCLPESLLLWWLLVRRGIEARLRVGVARPADGFRAHAWVELDGHALGPGTSPDRIFSAFDRDFGSTATDAR